MGMSANAILFYGYFWDEPTELLGEGQDTGEWDSILARRRGHADPWEAYPKGEGLDYAAALRLQHDWIAANDAAITAWYAVRQAVQSEFDCDIGYHGYCDYSVPYVYAGGSEATVEAGCFLDPAAHLGKPTAEWDRKLERFLTELGINKPEGQEAPRWWLVSYYG